MTTPFAFEILTWLIAAFFLVGASINAVAPASIRADYARWGYPAWFHAVTALLEVAVVVLLLVPGGRMAGVVLGLLVMMAATGTTLFHREYKRAIAPAVVLLLLLTLGWSLLSNFGA